MPWMIPSHPGFAVPLKLWRPRLFSGLALCLGSMAPDLEFILRLDYDWILSHTAVAQVYFTVPLVLLLHALATRIVLPWLLPLLPAGPPLHLDDLAAIRAPETPKRWWIVAWSGLLGGLSHVALDGFTHGNHSGWALPLFPVLATRVPHPGGAVALHDALQAWATLLLGLAAVGLWRRIGRERLLWTWRGEAPRPVRRASSFERRGAALWFAACALVGALTGPSLRAAPTPGRVLELAVYGALAFTAFGLVFAALVDRLRVPQARRPDGPWASADA